MEQLTILLKKIELRLSKTQLTVLSFILNAYFINISKSTLAGKVHAYHIYQIYEKKIRPKETSLKQEMKLKLDIAQAVSLFTILSTMNTEGLIYETALIDYITGEIDRQTV